MKNLFHFTGKFENHEEIILRDYLALERTRLANERTLFSYVRTALYLLTVGVGILQIDSVIHLVALAWVSIVAGILICSVGIVRFIRLRRELNTYLQ